MAGAVSDCSAETDVDADASYTDVSSYVGDTASSNGTPPVASRMSFLPYIIAATVSTMFLAMYFWNKKVSPLVEMAYERLIYQVRICW